MANTGHVMYPAFASMEALSAALTAGPAYTEEDGEIAYLNNFT
jgi:hypothetical protein